MQPRVTKALTRALFVEWARFGYAALSLEAVAKRAGVGKAALYRRWPSKLDMVADRLETVGISITAVPCTGSLESDLTALLTSVRNLLRHRMVRSILSDLHAEMPRNLSLAVKIHGRLQRERREQSTAILRRAIEHGEIAGDLNRNLFNDAGIAALYWRQVVLEEKADDAYVSALVRMMVASLLSDRSTATWNDLSSTA